MDEYVCKQVVIDAMTQSVCGDTWEVEKAIEAVRQLPAADVVPVVRCKDCKNWQTDWNPSIPDRHYCAVMDSMMKADDFCSYGERKE